MVAGGGGGLRVAELHPHCGPRNRASHCPTGHLAHQAGPAFRFGRPHYLRRSTGAGRFLFDSEDHGPGLRSVAVDCFLAILVGG